MEEIKEEVWDEATQTWKKAEPPKSKTYYAKIKYTAGTKTFPEITDTQSRKILKCLTDASVPVQMKKLPRDKKVEATFNIVFDPEKELQEIELDNLTKIRADKLKKCLESFEGLVDIKVGKMEEKLGEVL
jgi:hypothetical protein